jgi:hypothetical protein
MSVHLADILSLQAYEAAFRIRHVLAHCSQTLRSDISDDSLRKGVIIADMALDMYFNDVKAIVATGVDANIQELSANADDSDIGNFIKPKDRRASLAAWMKVVHPLDYGQNAFTHLVKAIASTLDDISTGLPNLEMQRMSLESFASLLYDMGQEDAGSGVEAPILSKGQFLPVLKVAIKSIGSLAPLVSRKKFVICALGKAAEFNKIHFIPWSQPQHGPGRRAKTPVWNSWMQLGAPPPAQGNAGTCVSLGSAGMAQVALAAQKRAEAADTNADWTAGDVNLDNLHLMLERTKLPSDWEIPTECSEQTKATYLWFKNHYDRCNVAHHLGIIIAIILSRNLPNLFAPDDTTFKLEGKNRIQTREIARAAPWVTKPGRRGMKEPSVFLSMFSTFIAALYCEESPLREDMKLNNGAMGKNWTDKHSTLTLFHFAVPSDAILVRSKGCHIVQPASRGCNLGSWSQGM